jgi:hypothetical protein
MSLDRLASDVLWHTQTQKLKELLNQPLPGGRGFQVQRDREIKSLCADIATLELPNRYPTKK